MIGLNAGEGLREELVADEAEILPSEYAEVFAVENHRLDAASFRRDYETLKRLVLARHSEGAVAQLKAMTSRC